MRESNDESFQYMEQCHGCYAAMCNESPIKATGISKKACGCAAEKYSFHKNVNSSTCWDKGRLYDET